MFTFSNILMLQKKTIDGTAEVLKVLFITFMSSVNLLLLK